MKKVSASIGAALAILGLAAAQPARANVWCTGTVVNVIWNPDGSVGVDFVDASNVHWGGWWCNVTGTVNADVGSYTQPITSDNCRALYSSLLTAHAANRSVTMLFYGTPATCATVAPGQMPGRIYF